MQIGNHQYKLLFLDTNALREITLNTHQSRKGFFQRFFSGDTAYAPCFSFYNIIELRPYDDIFDQFLNLFSGIPCLMFFPFASIIQEEYQCNIKNCTFKISNHVANAFTPNVESENYNLRQFMVKALNDPLSKTIRTEINNFPQAAIEWQKQRSELSKNLKALNLPLNIVNDNFYLSMEEDAIIKNLEARNMSIPKCFNINYFPALRIAEYSHFCRVHLTQKKLE